MARGPHPPDAVGYMICDYSRPIDIGGREVTLCKNSVGQDGNCQEFYDRLVEGLALLLLLEIYIFTPI